MLKHSILCVVNSVIFACYRRRFVEFFSNVQNEKVYIFDLDNTIANTWVTFLQKYDNHKERLRSIPVFLGMKKYLDNRIDCKIVILTAREYWYSGITKKWIEDNNIKYDLLIIVPKPKNKIELLSKIAINCLYLDDLSYNHEHGEIKFYEDEINQLSKMKNIQYIGYKEIAEINGEVI